MHLTPRFCVSKCYRLDGTAFHSFGLCKNYFCIHDFRCRFTQCVHPAYPFHRMFGFQFFGYALMLCHLFHQPKKQFCCLPINIRKIAVQPAACFQNLRYGTSSFAKALFFVLLYQKRAFSAQKIRKNFIFGIDRGGEMWYIYLWLAAANKSCIKLTYIFYGCVSCN